MVTMPGRVPGRAGLMPGYFGRPGTVIHTYGQPDTPGTTSENTTVIRHVAPATVDNCAGCAGLSPISAPTRTEIKILVARRNKPGTTRHPAHPTPDTGTGGAR